MLSVIIIVTNRPNNYMCKITKFENIDTIITEIA